MKRIALILFLITTTCGAGMFALENFEIATIVGWELALPEVVFGIFGAGIAVVALWAGRFVQMEL